MAQDREGRILGANFRANLEGSGITDELKDKLLVGGQTGSNQSACMLFMRY
jgi:hypothetical protein